MAAFGYACACALALLLVLAAVPKALHPADTSTGFAALGVPAAAVLARVVPGVEVAVAWALIVWPRVGGVAALILLVTFSLFLARAVRRGVRAPCNCFGQTTGDPISAVDLLRNAVLAALAAAALLTNAPADRTWTSTLAIAGGLVTALILERRLHARHGRRPHVEPTP